jgi:hypothetical protein
MRPAADEVWLRFCGDGGRVEILWWRRDAWGLVGTFGAVFALDETITFITDGAAFWNPV